MLLQKKYFFSNASISLYFDIKFHAQFIQKNLSKVNKRMFMDFRYVYFLVILFKKN